MFRVFLCLPAIYLYSTLGLLTLVEKCYRNKDDDDYDHEDDYSSNSVNFQARTSRFGMKVCLDNMYNLMIIKVTIMILMMMMMVMMIKMIIAVSMSIFKLRPPVLYCINS